MLGSLREKSMRIIDTVQRFPEEIQLPLRLERWQRRKKGWETLRARTFRWTWTQGASGSGKEDEGAGPENSMRRRRIGNKI